MSPPPAVTAEDAAAAEDHTTDLPEELLTLVFLLLGSVNRKRCSLVCRRWLSVKASSCLRLTLDARALLLTESIGSCAFGAKGI